jgi:hypothetical protein|tara:strand:+ start:1192 stop:1512 length:321 start_codon:yes stop_codon:yes gene_type:complete
MGLNVRFTVGVIVIIVVGFSASAYFFSMNPLGEFTDSISIMTVDKSKYIEKIDQCLNEQTVSGVTLNSFTAKWAQDFKLKIMEAETNDELESVMSEFYTIVSHCKP